ncbi:glutamate-ammonia-ligase adenylyltransferase [Rubricella aquisinus]|uniref:Glutamate-ammonia-ligase adenylyltransferase n=1 Tax=Rubricella aquisinus TaxID=2028108 RepID=A0A840WUG9_9RHOB|nr:glutamate-ammonia-ligase adenylyltransferase [Rubricella aquisinus]
MSLSSDIEHAPIPFDQERGEEAAALFADASAQVQQVIAGMAGSASYLHRLILREHDWLSAHLSATPDEAFADALTLGPVTSIAEMGVALRRAKRRVALLCAYCDLSGIWPVMTVTNRLTEFADFAVEQGLRALLADEVRRNKVPGASEADLDEACGMVVLAMGKMGAGELNYSSDIDLIVLFDDDRYADADVQEARAAFVRVTKKLMKLLSDVTADGYVFRTDLRLRPDPSVTPVCLSITAAERYYESVGRTWERAAYIKARPCAGAKQAGWAFLASMAPFVYRKHLDFAAIEDAHNMIRAIRSHKGLAGPITIPGHDMKLGRGGIREIEFFVQTRQLICGGRDTSLRGRETLQSLEALVRAGWLKPDVADTLAEAYRAHRQTEHLVQMMDDAQTHKLPTGDEGLARLAALAGWEDRAAYERELRNRLEAVHKITEPDAATPAQATTDKAEVFLNSGSVKDTVERWYALPATRSDRARRLFERLRPDILGRLSDAADPDDALRQFDAFLTRLPAGVQVFSLLDANRALLDLLVEICAAAPRLARYLGRNSGVFDAVLARDFFGPLPDAAAMERELTAWLDPLSDYETVLDTVRRWNKEVRFRVGVHLLRGLASHGEAGGAFADIADVSLRALLPHVIADFARKHGAPPGRGIAIVGMGKLGTREMTATSDLDLIMIYDAQGEAESNGPKPLSSGAYYARLTRALTGAITVPTAEGALYEVDMRLRPSGRQGPVAVSLPGFVSYQQSEAWTWEHLALCRGRVLAGEDALAADVRAAIRDVLLAPHDAGKVAEDVRAMRQRLQDAHGKADADPWEVKQGQGRLLDIDLLVQMGVLLNGLGAAPIGPDAIDRLEGCGWLTPSQATHLFRAQQLMLHVQAVARVAVEGRFHPDHAGDGLNAVLTRETGCDDIPTLERRLAEYARDAAQVIAERLRAP